MLQVLADDTKTTKTIELFPRTRLQGMSHWIMWEMSSLFEHIGTVQDGMGTLSKLHAVVGGFHLGVAPPDYLDHAITELKALDPDVGAVDDRFPARIEHRARRNGLPLPGRFHALLPA